MAKFTGWKPAMAETQDLLKIRDPKLEEPHTRESDTSIQQTLVAAHDIHSGAFMRRVRNRIEETTLARYYIPVSAIPLSVLKRSR